MRAAAAGCMVEDDIADQNPVEKSDGKIRLENHVSDLKMHLLADAWSARPVWRPDIEIDGRNQLKKRIVPGVYITFLGSMAMVCKLGHKDLDLESNANLEPMHIHWLAMVS